MTTHTSSRNSTASFFKKGETFASSLLLLILDHYGTEALEWTPETLIMEIEGDFGIKLPENNIEKINAIVTAITTDQFYRDPVIFGHICDALNDQPVDMAFVPCPQPEECAWGITEVSLLEGDKRAEFSQDVRRYLGVVLEQFGLLHPPDVLKIADYHPAALDNAESNTADDPILYSGFYSRNKSDGDAIIDYIKTRVVHLLREVNELPLTQRSHEDWQKFYNAAMKKFNSLATIEED